MTVEEIMAKSLEQWQGEALARRNKFLRDLFFLEKSTTAFSEELTHFCGSSTGACYGLISPDAAPSFNLFFGSWYSSDENTCWYLGRLRDNQLAPFETLTTKEEYEAYKANPN